MSSFPALLVFGWRKFSKIENLAKYSNTKNSYSFSLSLSTKSVSFMFLQSSVQYMVV